MMGKDEYEKNLGNVFHLPIKTAPTADANSGN